jgi:16S rRNA (cytosine967-C5)-methyltransferase
MLVAGIEWNPAVHTPWLDLLQKDYSPAQFAKSHLSQPDLFVRIRPGRRKIVLEALAAAGIDFKNPEEDCLQLSNGLELENILRINREVIIQDYSSQKCGAVIKTHLKELKGILWDACAASGGKSIMMHDYYPGKFRIVASDIRPTILHNLKTRYAEAGVPVNHVMVADLTKPLVYKNIEADVALVDVPCSGSGTWSRTPEQHYFFQKASLQAFSERQFQITRNVMEHVKPNGYIIYITCSVFDDENSFVTDRLVAEAKLTLLHAEIIDGTTHKADSMYIAIFQKN